MNRKKYIYILSQRYSGSTLLSFLLGTHPDIATIGERRKFYINSIADGGRDLKCSCGESFQDCSHWNHIKTGLFQEIDSTKILHNPTEFQLFKNKYLNRLAYEVFFKSKTHRNIKGLIPYQDRINKQLHFNQVLVNKILEIGDKTSFLDSSKTITHLPFISSMEGFDLYVIWLSRDPKAQVHSAMKYNNWTVEKAAKEWKKEMDGNGEVLDSLGLNYCELSYEELCKKPEVEMKRILEFAGLDSSTYSLDFRSQQQHIMGNFKMRLGKDSKIEVRNEWKEQLSQDDILTIDKICS